MNSQVLLSIFQVAAGGTFVQLLVFLLRRRSEIKSLDAGTDKTILASATEHAAQLAADFVVQRTMNADLLGQIKDLKADLERELGESKSRADIASDEIRRLQGITAQLRTDLGIAQGQVQQLQDALDTRGRHQL